MPSCSRIARRCGEREASSSGGAGGASAMPARRRLRRDPELFRRPPARPLGRDPLVVLVRLRALGCVELDQPVELEAVGAQEVDQLPGWKMELDFLGVWPFDAMHCAERSDELLGDPVNRHAQRDERRVAHEDQAPTGTREARGLWNPALRISPDRCAVLRMDNVEGRVRQRYVFAGRFDQRKLDSALALQTPRRLELGRCRIDADDTGAAAREPRREVRRPATELDDVERADLAKEWLLRSPRVARHPNPPPDANAPAARKGDPSTWDGRGVLPRQSTLDG